MQSTIITFPICPLGIQEAQNAEARPGPEENMEPPDTPLLSRVAFHTPSTPERPGTSTNPPAYTDLSQVNSLLLPSSSPTSAALLPRPQAVGSPGHPTPGPLGLGMGMSVVPSPGPSPSTPYLGNGDGSSSDSLDRQAAGQEDEDEEDEDSSEYENLVSEAPVPAGVLALGRPATLCPDGDPAPGSQTS